MRRPDVLTAGHPFEVGRGDGAGPLATVLDLAPAKFGHDMVGLALDLSIAGAGVDAGRSRKPVSEKMAADLAGGGFPPPMDVAGIVTRRPQPRLQIEVLEQVPGLEAHHIAPVEVEAPPELAGPECHIAEIELSECLLHA